MNVANAAALRNFLLQFEIGHPANRHASAVVEQDLKFFDVVVNFAGHLGVGAARVVADHSAKAAVVVGGWVGAPAQAIVGIVHYLLAQFVAHGSGQDACPAFGGVYLQNFVHVLRPINHDRRIAALAGKAGATSAREQRSSESAAGGDSLDDIFFGFWNDDADGD